MSTPAACLARIGRIDFDERSASFFRFARELAKECRPRGIRNAFSKTMGMDHAIDAEVLHADHTEAIDDLAAVLMGEVVTPEADTLMDTSHHLTMCVAFRCPFRKFGVLALHLCQCLSSLRKKRGLAISAPSDKVAKVLSPTLRPTWVGISGKRSGSHSTEKETYHLPVDER